MKILFISLGCDKNLADSETMLGLLASRGYQIVDTEEDADVIIVNTCCFIHDAMEESIETILQMAEYKKSGSLKALIVTGCMAERYREEITKEIPEVDAVLGTASYGHILDAVDGALAGQSYLKMEPLDTLPLVNTHRMVTTGGHYAYLKIAEGCDKHCTYCIIPKLRGNFRSVPMEHLLREAKQLADDGVKEIILLGQNVNSYGNDLDLNYHFPDLLADIDRIPGEYLIRFMSSHPKDATPRLFDVMAASSHVAKQLHLPFQSGNDRVLKEMNRRYTRQQYLDLVNYAKRVMPGLVLTSDVIIGFPGETEAEAMDTVSLVEEVGFDALFTFIYSPRPGTKAAAMPDPATRAEKQKWFDRLLEVQNNMSAKLHAAYVGKTVRVLVDGESDDPEYPLTSRTEGNRLVRLKGDKALIGQFADVAVTGSNTWALYGEAV